MGTQTEVQSSYTANNSIASVDHKVEFSASSISAVPGQTTGFVSQTADNSKANSACLLSPMKSLDFKDFLNTSQSNIFPNLYYTYGETVRPNYLPTYSSYTPTVNYDTLYSPKYYQPNKSVGQNSSSPPYKPYSSYSKPGNLMSQSETCFKSKTKPKAKSQKTSKCSKSGKMDGPDHNNNFLKQRRGVYNSNPSTWADCNVCDRLSQLAQPKRLPCEYRENRRSVYWMTKRPPPKEGCNHTHFEVTPRVAELAQPKIVCGQFCGVRHCIWECEYPQPPLSCKDPREVDWCRLSRPKTRYPPDPPAEYVKKRALKAKASPRIKELAKPIIRENTVTRELKYS